MQYPPRMTVPMTLAGTLSLRWPLPAVLTWLASWLCWAAALRAGLATPWALLVAVSCSVLCALACRGPWRRLLVAGGFPVSAVLMGAAAAWPSWIWPLLALPLLAAYPLRAWRDAPFFPTPAQALQGLDRVITQPPQRVLDAGCGMGHGLAALRRLWPRAELVGLEWSPVLAWLAAGRGRTLSVGAAVRVQRGDMWAVSWAGYDVVYVFQRPESMARVWDKASRELGANAWLVSLEFAVPGQQPVACLQGPMPAQAVSAGQGRDRRPLWVYRPGAIGAAAQPSHSIAGHDGR